jgi:predicted dehydrogenase
VLCESSCSGNLQLHFDTLIDGHAQRDISVGVQIVASSNEATTKGKDIYELSVFSSTGKQLTLYDFTKLRDGEGNELVAAGSYGRQECVREFLKAVRGVTDANLVSPAQAWNAQRIIQAMKR